MTTNSTPASLKKLVILLAITIPTHAQILHPTDPLPSFEVATVKPWHRTPPPPQPDGTPAPQKSPR